MANVTAPQNHTQVPQLLCPEILGFSPQLLLDDIINVANNAVQDGVNGMEEFLEKWADARAERQGGDWDSTQEVEQGLVAFQTLLEYHTDIAFDFFEAWSLRNIFAIPSDLPVVLPHQQGLDLTVTVEREQELMEELEQLRKQVDNQRRLRRMYTRALQVSKRQRQRAEQRLDQLSLLKSPSLDVFGALPSKHLAMFTAVSTLPPLDASTIASLSQAPLADPSKRPWETSKTGYLNWAVGQLMDRTGAEGTGGGRAVVDALAERVGDVGEADQLRRVVEMIDGVKKDLRSADDMEE
ncbi:Centromere protein mis12 [Hypsizygus marmoreus]|uniref:Centromere protein mis12 n=1 Tax=Hypsizygus marmoreus TaxID=39966 RepID=A0A369J942_HYPMA|nr:Centromere protein mis12 [Hypsizygus marmoreus]